MAYSVEDVASGAFLISGHWFTISGTLAEVRQILDLKGVPEHKVKGFTYDGTYYTVLGHR